MKMSNQTYDVLKWICMVLLPAVGVFYVALANVWNLPFAAEVSATCAAIAAFMGTVLQISSAKFQAANKD